MTVHLTLKRLKEIGDRPWTVAFDCQCWSDRPTRPPSLGVRSPFFATTKLTVLRIYYTQGFFYRLACEE